MALKVERDRAVTVTRAYRVNLQHAGASFPVDRCVPGVLDVGPLGALRAAPGARPACAPSARRAASSSSPSSAQGAVLGLGRGSVLIGVLLGARSAAALRRLLSGRSRQWPAARGRCRVLTPRPRACSYLLDRDRRRGRGCLAARVARPLHAARRRSRSRAAIWIRAPPRCADGWRAPRSWRSGALAARRSPAVRGLPLFGYAAIAALLFGAVLLEASRRY